MLLKIAFALLMTLGISGCLTQKDKSVVNQWSDFNKYMWEQEEPCGGTTPKLPESPSILPETMENDSSEKENKIESI